MSSPITEEFGNSLGRWDYYDTGDGLANIDLQNRQHTDLRALDPAAQVVRWRMYSLAKLMSTLNPMTMLALEGTASVSNLETWSSVGIVGASSTYTLSND